MKRLFAFVAVVLCCAQAYGQCQLVAGQTPLGSSDFDTITDYHFYIDTLNSNNQWQIGKPQKNFLSAAYSPVNALVTDTINLPFVNDTSYATLVIPWIMENLYLKFRHKYDVDSNHQHAYLECSYDGGASWLMMNNGLFNPDCDFLEKGWQACDEDTTGLDSNHPFTGTSNGWHQSGYMWVWLYGVRLDVTDTVPCTIPPDTLLVRFVFVNDSGPTAHEGWMIDDLQVYSVAPGIGVDEVEVVKLSVRPNPVGNELALVTDGVLTRWWIRNVFGQRVMGIDNRRNANVSELAPGYYVVEAETADGAVGRKAFVKQ